MTRFADLSPSGAHGYVDATPMPGVHPSAHNALDTRDDALLDAGKTLEASVDALGPRVGALEALPVLSLLKNPTAGFHIPNRAATRLAWSRRRQRRLAWPGDSITMGVVRSQSYGQNSTGCFAERVGWNRARPWGGMISYGFRGMWLGDGTGGLPSCNGPEWSVPAGSAAWSVFPGFGASAADVALYAEAYTVAGGLANQLKWTKPAGWLEPIVGFYVYFVARNNVKFSVSNNDGISWTNVGNGTQQDNKLHRAYFNLAVGANGVRIRAARADNFAVTGLTIAGIEPCIVVPFGAAGSGSTTYGFVNDNIGRDGFTLNNLIRAASIGDPLAFWNQCQADSNEPQLTIDGTVCGFSNDVVVTGDLNLWRSNLSALKTRCDAAGSDLFVWCPFEQGGRDYTLQAAFRQATMDWAAQNGVACFNWYEAWQDLLGHASTGGAQATAANAAGLLGTGVPGTNTDFVHPSPPGNVDVASRFDHFLELAA